MKILLIGKNGQVGRRLNQCLTTLGDVIALDKQQLNLSDPNAIVKTIKDIKPNVIVNAAAYTAVDRAETEHEQAYEINAKAPLILAEEAKKLNSLLVHYSTDYVFDGSKSKAYHELDLPNPLNHYGLTKLNGEKAITTLHAKHLIFRTSWVYDASGSNFLLTMLRLAKEKDLLRIVGDQIGAPTWSQDIAWATTKILQKYDETLNGIYHMTSRGETSWFGFAQEIFKNVQGCYINEKKQYVSRAIPKLIEIGTHEYPTPAKRPKNSLLCNDKIKKTFNCQLPSWDVSLKLCMQELMLNH